MGWTVQLHPGSALRLSQPLSGFLAGPSSVALFHATTVPGILPSEHFPHKDRGPLSRPPAPLQLSTSVLKCAGARPFASGFTDVHAFTRLPGSPDDYGRPFHRPRPASRLPRVRAQRNHIVPPASPTSRLSSPCETVPVTPGCPSAPGRDSRGFLPLRSFLPPRLGSSTRPVPRDRTRSVLSEDSVARLEGPVTLQAG
jgi:hypothetical protein